MKIFSRTVWGVALWLATAGPALAQVPHLIRYQGQAVDSNGVPLEGPYTLIFRLYGVETGGAPVWEETQTNVQLSGGNFSVLLGQVQSLDPVDWSVPLWLGVQVNAQPELTPRQRITSVPLAIRAQTAEIVNTSGLTDDANALVPGGAIFLWAGTACPTGYTRLSALDGKFLVGGSTYAAAAGGSNIKDISHTHTTPPHNHGGVTGAAGTQNGSGQVDNLWNPPTHTHPIPMQAAMTTTSGGSTALDIRPAFATVLLCQKD